MLTPLDIHNKEFRRSFRGYNEDEIDEFLDQVVNDYEKLFRENAQLKEELERKKKDIDQYQQLEKNLQDTLLVAQRTAEEVVSNAKKTAEEMKENTARECQNIRQQTELEAKRSMDEAVRKVRGVIAEYDRLAREKNRFLMKLRVMMESELAMLNQTIDSIPHPEAEERLAKTGEMKLEKKPAVEPAKEAAEEKAVQEPSTQKADSGQEESSLEKAADQES